MSVLELSAVVSKTLRGAELTLDAGVHVVLGTPDDGTAELIAIAAGLMRPLRGRVLVTGRDPHTSPDVRRRTAALLAEEQLIPAVSVRASVARALALAGRQASAADAALAVLGIAGWANRKPTSLSAGELRSVALALALAHDRPALVLLYEPLVEVPGVARGVLLERLARLADGGACVLCSTASASDAQQLSSSLLLLDRGRLVRRSELPLSIELAPGTAPDFVVQSDNPRRLASEVTTDEAVAGVDWDQQQRPGEIRVRGADPGKVALAIARAAVHHSIQVHAVSPTLPVLDIVRGANDGLAQAAYEQAYYRTLAQARAPLRAEPRARAPGIPLYGAPAPDPGQHAGTTRTDSDPPGGGTS